MSLFLFVSLLTAFPVILDAIAPTFYETHSGVIVALAFAIILIAAAIILRVFLRNRRK